MVKINLAPDVRLDKLKLKRKNFLATVFAVIIIVFLLVVLIIVQGYRFVQKYSLDKTNQDIASTQEELKKYSDIEEMTKNIEQGLKAVDTISKSEPRWSIFLPQLEKVTPEDISFSDFSQDGNTFKASAEGESVTSIARLIKSLEGYEYTKPNTNSSKKLFKNVIVTGYTKNPDNHVSFTISFEMEGGLLW